MDQYLTYWDKIVLKLRITWWIFMVLVGKIFKTLSEVQENKLSFTKVEELTMAHMLQDQLFNQVQKVSTMQHVLQEWL